MKDYPNLTPSNQKDLLELARYITKERPNDVSDWQNLPNRFMSGRKVGKVPANATDITPDDRVGDFNYDTTYYYFVVDTGSGAEWRTLPVTDFTGGGGGIGTVTNVSVVTANGFSGTVANSTTTPAITINASGLDATKIGTGTVTSTEFGYLANVTSDIQTQIDGKQTSIQFKDEGSNLGGSGSANTVDFTGTGVTASRVGNTVTVNVSGAYGDVTGPGSATDNAVARYDGTTGKIVQNSGATIDDSGNLTANNFSGSSSGTNTGDQTNITGNAGTVTFVDAAGDTTTFVALGMSATGNQSPATDAGLTYNATTNVLTSSGGFVGNLTGDVTGNASTATALQTGRTIGGVTFDGTANIVPQTIQIVDAGGDTTTFPMLATSATGSLQPTTDAGLSYNATTNALTSTTFIGALTGNADTATTATTATNVTVANEATDTTCFLNFTTAATGSLGVKSNANATFNSNTGAAGFSSVTLGNTGLVVGVSTPFSDSAGTLTLQNVDALDATTESTIESAIDTLPNLTSIQGQSVTVSGTTTISGTNTGDQNLFGTIAVSGQSNVVADSTNDTLTIVAGTNVTITTDAATDSITINATGGSGGGDVSGPVSSTDDAVAVWNGTSGDLLQDSTLIYDGDLRGMTTVTLPNTGLHILDTNASHDLIIVPGSNLTADRTLTITTGDADRTLTLNGNFTATGSSSGTNTGDQTTSGTTNRITVTNGSTNPVIDISSSYVGQNTITTVGTVTTGTWNATDVGLGAGGTGASLADPNADRIFFWDDSAGSTDWLAPSSGLAITGTNLAFAAGTIVNNVYSEYTSNSNLTATIPLDDTIPQNTEGTEILTATITPKTTTNRIRVRFQGFGGTSTAATNVIAALFVDSTANALSASTTEFINNATAYYFGLEFEHVAGTTSSTTYKIRVGPEIAGTLRMNGINTGRFFGGVARSTLILEEIVA